MSMAQGREYVSYGASCPMCGYEHDYPTKRAMETDWNAWTQPLEKAMDGLSVALTPEDKALIRRSVGLSGK